MQIAWPHLYALVLFCGVVASLLTTPLFQKIAEKLDIMDRPRNERHKKHGHATPLLGGLALLTAWLAVIGGGLAGLHFSNGGAFLETLRENYPGVLQVMPRVWWLVLGAAGAAGLGLVDDIHSLKAYQKFAGQFVVALIAVVLGGVRISIFVDVAWVSIAISLFWFMLLMNAFNFFDNMDGLAIGTAAIAMGLFTVVAAFQEQYFVGSLSALSCGVAVGFWFYNTSPATIFMGDSGSHFIGYLMAVISGSATYFATGVSSTRLPVLLPLFILAVPLFDTAAVTVIRALHGKPFWVGDHNHISHRFVKMGMSRKRAVQLVHLLCLILGLSVLPVLWGSPATAVVVMVQGGLLLLMITMLQYCVAPQHADLMTVPPDREEPAAKPEEPKHGAGKN